MATSKLLKPTNVTISIPEFTDQPDQRVNSNCIDKEADAINALSEHIVPKTFSSFANAYTNGVTGISFCKISEGSSDAPSQTGVWNCLQNNNDSNYGWQLAMQSNSNDVYFRTKFTGSWRAWSLLTNTKTTSSATGNTSVINSSPVNRVAKMDKLAVWNFNANLKANASTSTVIATLPEGYRPAVEVRFAGRRGSAVDMYVIGTNGELKTLLNTANNGDWVSFSVSYDV